MSEIDWEQDDGDGTGVPDIDLRAMLLDHRSAVFEAVGRVALRFAWHGREDVLRLAAEAFGVYTKDAEELGRVRILGHRFIVNERAPEGALCLGAPECAAW